MTPRPPPDNTILFLTQNGYTARPCSTEDAWIIFAAGCDIDGAMFHRAKIDADTKFPKQAAMKGTHDVKRS